MRWPCTRRWVSPRRRSCQILALAVLMCLLLLLLLLLRRAGAYFAFISLRENCDFESEYFHPGVVDSWPQNRSRDLRLYILPHTETSLLQPSWKAADYSPYLLVIVITRLGNFARRNVVRETWGSVREAANMTTRVVFIVGIPAPGFSNTCCLQKLVKKESDRYGDVLQENFVDSYYNLTLKSVFALKWACSFYPSARFVMKVDDDTFVRISAVVSLLLTVEAARARAGGGPVPLPGKEDRPPLAPGPFLLGALYCATSADRYIYSKWYAPEYLYAEKMYPSHLSGSAYLLSGDAVHLLLFTALRTPLYHLEDIFITGICARAAGLEPRDLPGITDVEQTISPCQLKSDSLLTLYALSNVEVESLWWYLQLPNRTSKCRVGMETEMERLPVRCP